MTKKIFVIAGEASGDALGAGLIRHLYQKAGRDIEIVGVGGLLMEAETQTGFKSLLPMDELCVMGLWEVVWQLPRLLRLINGVVDEIKDAKPDIVVTIDLPDFNFRVADRLKKSSDFKGKIVHYVAPTVWAWRPGRAKKIAQIYDGLMCLFPFEPEYFEPHGLNAVCVGHSLVEHSVDQVDVDSFRSEYGIDPASKTLGVFLGSREGEIKKTSTSIMETVSIVKETYPDIEIIVPTLPSMEYHVVDVLRNWQCEATVVIDPGVKWGAFRACDVAIALSGTVALELAYFGIPHIIGYKMHPVTWLLVKHMVKVRYAHLANLLLKKEIVPEFLQFKCNAESMSGVVLKLLKLDESRQEQRNSFKELRNLLGALDQKRPSEKAADFELNTLHAQA